MANKKLKVGATSEVKLPTKKDKSEKKPKWQAKIGGKKAKMVETPVQEEPTLAPEPTEVPGVATSPEPAEVEPTATDDAPPTPDPEPIAPEASFTDDPADAHTHKKPRKLKVKTEAPPKKLSMVAAALQVLQDRQDAMTCPELIDVMATEGLWVSPGGKTPANTLYAAISRDIKVNGTGSAFRKAERGRFEAKVVAK